MQWIVLNNISELQGKEHAIKCRILTLMFKCSFAFLSHFRASVTSVRHLTCTLTRCQSSTHLSRKVCFISLQFSLKSHRYCHFLFLLSSTSCWFVSKTLNPASVIVNHSRVCLNLDCPAPPDGGVCSLRNEQSHRLSFPVGSERKRSIWLSLPHLISITQHISSSLKWPHYPQEAGCSQ